VTFVGRDDPKAVEWLSSPIRDHPAPALYKAIEQRERPLLPSIVLYKWLGRPRTPEELGVQEALFSETAIPFGPAEAALTAQLYRTLKRPRGREIEIAIAARAFLKEAPSGPSIPLTSPIFPG
jgi:hypothetical protein